jgi:hypothetical protein
MIGQYLPNNNEKSYSAVLQKKLELNLPLVSSEIKPWALVSNREHWSTRTIVVRLKSEPRSRAEPSTIKRKNYTFVPTYYESPLLTSQL